MDNSIEESLKELRAEMARIAARLDSQDASSGRSKQKPDVPAEDRPEIMGARIIKDIADSIQQRNEAVWSQLSGRWDFVQGLLIVVTLVFTVIVGISAYNFNEARKAVDEVESRASQTKKDIADAVADARTYSDLLGYIALASTLVSEGYREFERKDYPESRTLTGKAIDSLDDAFIRIGRPIADIKKVNTFNPKTCRLESAVASIVPCDTNELKGAKVAQLYPALCATYFSAMDLRARATFSLPKSIPRNFVAAELRRAGQILMLLDRSRNEGYHWVGIAEALSRHNDEAIACFELSSHQTTGTAAEKDFVNLAETAFTVGRYDDAEKYAKSYLQPRGYPFGTAIEIIAQFYLSIAQFILETDLEGTKKFRKQYGSLGENPLGASFSDEALELYLSESDSPFLRLNAKQQAEVRRMAACLKNKVTCQ